MRLALITSQAISLLNFRGPLIAEMVARGVEVFAIAPDFDDQVRKSVSAIGAVPIDCRFSRTGINPLYDLVAVLRLARVLRRVEVDVVLGYFIKPVIFGTLAAVIARVPHRFCMIEGLGYVFTPAEGLESLRRKSLRILVSLLYKFALKYVRKAFLLNDDDVSEMIGRGLLQKTQVIKLGGIGVDLQEWLPAPPFKGPITFVLAARLLREKGILDFVEAARIVKESHPEVNFVLLGGLDSNPGGLKSEEVFGWVAEGLLVWPGHVPVRPWFAQASVFVLPSYREGVPRSTQEAMAMGRAVITTDAPGCRDTVIDGRNGFLVPVRNPVALSQAMLRFVDVPALIEKMGDESRAIAIERFDVHKVNDSILTAIGIVKLPLKAV